MERLDRKVVHEICANQAVVTLSACVKELVENSLDAGATRIEVRFRESGAELIEVIDNGSGIAAENFEKLAARHATSKIRSFNEIHSTLNTYGFRGEALSAICTLADLTVCTRTADAAAAAHLKYDHFGSLAEKNSEAREVGTTVTVCNLFSRLPVRHREFMRGLKTQFSSTLKLLQAYAIGLPAVRFHVNTERPRGAQISRTALIATSGVSQGWRAATSAVLGASSVVDVEPFELESEESGFKVVGIMSTTMGGRRSRDVQLFYINNRPIDPPRKVVKLINDTYHQFNSRMWPAVVLDFSGAQSLIDVNVTPDKRTVLMQNETVLLKDLQQRLVELWTPAAAEGSVALGDFGIRTVPAPIADQGNLGGKDEEVASPGGARDEEVGSPAGSRERSRPSVTPEKVEEPPLKKARSDAVEAFLQSSALVEPAVRVAEFPARFNKSLTSHSAEQNPAEAKFEDLTVVDFKPTESAANSLAMNAFFPPLMGAGLQASSQPGSDPQTSEPASFQMLKMPAQGAETESSSISPSAPGESQVEALLGQLAVSSTSKIYQCGPFHLPGCDCANIPRGINLPEADVLEEVPSATSSSAPPVAPNIGVSVDLEKLRGAVEKRRRRATAAAAAAPTARSQVAFPRAFSLASLRQGKNSLEEVASHHGSSQLSIDQRCFAEMRVLGQFNLGFVIAALATSGGLQLFIIDQHASDEKIRFEMLNRESKIDRQPLVSPLNLELSPAQEQVVLANLEAFRCNGFELVHDAERPPGRRMRLTTLPVCQNLIFSEKDLHAFIFTLEEGGASDVVEAASAPSSSQGLLALGQHRSDWGPGTVPRPPKVWTLLASRACRGAVMVGRALRVREMERILNDLSKLEQPWNCPHGRPTMRHLADMSSVKREAPREPPLLSSGILQPK